MIYVNWPNINKRFFDSKVSPKPNSETQEFASGRTVTTLKNTRFIFTVNVSLTLNKKEEKVFWDWYKNQLGGLAGVFRCPELKEGPMESEYFRFTAEPDEDKVFSKKKFILEIEEVY